MSINQWHHLLVKTTIATVQSRFSPLTKPVDFHWNLAFKCVDDLFNLQKRLAEERAVEEAKRQEAEEKRLAALAEQEKQDEELAKRLQVNTVKHGFFMCMNCEQHFLGYILYFIAPNGKNPSWTWLFDLIGGTDSCLC